MSLWMLLMVLSLFSIGTVEAPVPVKAITARVE
jgi:hypothetical protein